MTKNERCYITIHEIMSPDTWRKVRNVFVAFEGWSLFIRPNASQTVSRLGLLRMPMAINPFTAPACNISGLEVVVEVLLHVHRNRRLIRDGNPGRPPRLSHSSWALTGLEEREIWCLMSSDVNWHIRDKLWPMPKHSSINLYVHGNQKAR